MKKTMEVKCALELDQRLSRCFIDSLSYRWKHRIVWSWKEVYEFCQGACMAWPMQSEDVLAMGVFEELAFLAKVASSLFEMSVEETINEAAKPTGTINGGK